MGSYIEEFMDDYEKRSDTVITIDGPSGAGKGTAAEQIGSILDLPVYSAGDFFREIAKERGMTVEELSEEADRETDLDVDRRTLQKGLKEDCVIESRIAGRVLGDYSDLKIYMTAEVEERAQRSLKDIKEGKREDEEDADSLEEVEEKIRKRDKDNRERYKRYYGIDTQDLEIYDAVIDNTEMDVEEQEEELEKLLREMLPERTFG